MKRTAHSPTVEKHSERSEREMSMASEASHAQRYARGASTLPPPPSDPLQNLLQTLRSFPKNTHHTASFNVFNNLPYVPDFSGTTLRFGRLGDLSLNIPIPLYNKSAAPYIYTRMGRNRERLLPVYLFSSFPEISPSPPLSHPPDRRFDDLS